MNNPQPAMPADSALIDDFSHPEGRSRLGTSWRLVTDGVMGGISQATMTRIELDGRRALCLEGEVNLEHQGGFVQVNLALTPTATPLNARGLTGVRLVVRGNDEVYHVHLKTADSVLPWQSYRAAFTAGPDWREIRLPFSDFEPHRLGSEFNPARLTKLGIVAIGRAFRARVCLAEVGWYRDAAASPP